MAHETFGYVAKRLLIGVIVLLGVYTLVFVLCFMMPGDPVRASMGLHADPVAMELQRDLFGLNDPRYVQYFRYASNFIRGDWGMSFRYDQQPVLDLILQRLPRTAYLGLWSIIFCVTISIPLGIVAAFRQNTATDNAAVLVSQIGVSLPNFWFGLMLMVVFAVLAGWVDPVPQITDDVLWSFPGFFTSLKDYSLAIITLGTGMMASITKLLREEILEVSRQDYITLLRAKGLPERSVQMKHALRNALIPVITIIGMQVLLLISGAVLTETVFGINGLGRLYVDSVMQRDWFVIMGSTMLITIGVVLINIMVDLIYMIIDPRVKLR
jgi:ABC-type dipeptide/oligopeptide/nickel transport systems, permease components